MRVKHAARSRPWSPPPSAFAGFRFPGATTIEAFHLVVPSIPGFGFSGPTRERGWDIARVARARAELMRRLGYDRYGAQGGDWGSGISTTLGAVDPDHVVGVHVNYLPTPPPPDGGEDGLSEQDIGRLARIKQLMAFFQDLR